MFKRIALERGRVEGRSRLFVPGLLGSGCTGEKVQAELDIDSEGERAGQADRDVEPELGDSKSPGVDRAVSATRR